VKELKELDANDAPDLLAKPRGLEAVRRLNIKPLLIGGGLLVLVVVALVASLQGRGGGASAPEDATETATSAERLAQEMVADQPLGVIGERAPAVKPAAVHTAQTDDQDQVPTAPLPAFDPDTQPPVVAASPPGPLAQARRQRHLQLLWERHARLQQAIQAGTRVDFDTAPVSGAGGATAASPAVLDPAAEFQRTLAGAAAQLGAATQGQARDPNQESQKKAFLQQAHPTGALSHRRQSPASPYEIKTGTVIPAVMVSGISSDLPGILTAQVAQHVWDTATGGHLLIPQGTRLYGTYDSQVAYGQKRVLVAWTRLIFPDASTLELDTMPGADPAGYAGFKDKVDRHLLRILGGAVLMSVIGAGFQMSQPDADRESPTPQQQAAAQLAQELAQVSREQIGREMDVQPTLVIRPGYRFNVMVNQDITLEPYPFGGHRGSGRREP
jgi:type IV secretion system protein VirB10